MIRKSGSVFLLSLLFFTFFSAIAWGEIITFRLNLADDFMADLPERSDWALVKYDTEAGKIISFKPGEFEPDQKLEPAVKIEFERQARLALAKMDELRERGLKFNDFSISISEYGGKIWRDTDLSISDPNGKYGWRKFNLGLVKKLTPLQPISAPPTREELRKLVDEGKSNTKADALLLDVIDSLKNDQLKKSVAQIVAAHKALKVLVERDLKNSGEISESVARLLMENRILTAIVSKRADVPISKFSEMQLFDSLKLPNVRILPSVREDIRGLGEENFIRLLQNEARKERSSSGGIAEPLKGIGKLMIEEVRRGKFGKGAK